MAIDTAERRRSVSGVALLIPGVTPDSDKDEQWRSQVGWSYSGLMVDDPGPDPGPEEPDDSLFNLEDALSCELAAAYQLADRLSETIAIQHLAEAATEVEALAKIIVGIAEDPFDGEAYTLEEMEVRHFVGHIYAEVQEGHVAGLSPEAMGTPREGGVFRLYLCRQIRESEDPRDAYNFFWDRISAIGPAVILASDQDLIYPDNYRFRTVQRTLGPQQTTRRAEGANGKRLEALLAFTWGDIETE